MDKHTLEQVADWADARVKSGEEPPWTFQNLKRLVLIARELSEGMGANVEMVSEQGQDLPADDSPKQGADIIQLDSFRSRPAATNSRFLPT